MNERRLARVRESLANWYRQNARDLPWRRTSDPYEIWISEVMLQQTQVRTVIPYYRRFLATFPTLTTLAAAPIDAVLKAWEGLGYYARARNLRDACSIVVKEHRGRVPEDPAAFRRLPGVGPYICAAVQSIAFGHALAVVDGNVKRVLSRIGCLDAPVNSQAESRVFESAAGELLDSAAPGAFNQAVMELGALICRPSTPQCGDCPLFSTCRARLDGRVAEFPVRRSTPRPPRFHVAVGVVRRGERVLLTRRPDSGLLGGLWEFPGGKVGSSESAEDACRREIREEVNLDVVPIRRIARVRHAYTHFSVDIDAYECCCDRGEVVLDGPVDFRWVRPQEIRSFALPKATHKILPHIEETG